MKILFLFVCVLSSVSAFAESFKLKDWDQLKLGELLSRIPAEAKVLKVTPVTEPALGRKERIIFPRWVGALKIICENITYGNSQVISASTCTFSIDSHHPDVSVNYDQYKILLKNPTTVQALMVSIHGGPESKEYRSGYMDDGINFEGRATNIFHYLFKCKTTECELRVSKKIQEDAAGQ